MKTLYLCGPIADRNDADAHGWRDLAVRLWPGKCLNPMRRDYRGMMITHRIATEIVEQDLVDIQESHALLVHFDVASVGSSMEVFYAKHVLLLPVITINASGRPPSPWLLYHSNVIVPDVRTGVDVAWGMVS